MLLPQKRVDGRSNDQPEEQAREEPQPACREQGIPAVPYTGEQAGPRDGEHREVGELDPDRRRAEVELGLRLVAQVQEDDRKRSRRHEGGPRGERAARGSNGREPCSSTRGFRPGRRP
jgi:hypothetical protein